MARVMTGDPRLTPARPDLAAEKLRGEVESARFAAPRRMRIVGGVAPLRCARGKAALDAQLLHGTPVDVYEIADGMAWLQSARDGYVGYVPEAHLAEPGPAPTHRVSAPLSNLYPEADLKTEPLAPLPMTAELSGEIADGWLVTADGCVPAQHVAPIDETAPDWVDEAQRFFGAPYLWGGHTWLGIDCSGLIQVARHAAGFACPRDSDMQAAEGAEIETNAEIPETLNRGDLVFWRGHVGVMLDAETLLHANAHHMAVAAEPLAQAVERIRASDTGAPTAFRRLAP